VAAGEVKGKVGKVCKVPVMGTRIEGHEGKQSIAHARYQTSASTFVTDTARHVRHQYKSTKIIFIVTFQILTLAIMNMSLLGYSVM
jgi:hypothetical protein